VSKVKKMDNCPICDGEIQFTHVHETYGYYEEVEFLMIDGKVVINGGDEASEYHDPQWMETRIYCENDHTEKQMCAFMALSMKQEASK